ncbi:MAG: sulfatase-like hydrolase/transferase [Ginsengibacter sp.]
MIKPLIPKSVPPTIHWIIKIALIYTVIFTILRIATVVLFIPSNVSVASVLPSFWLGFRYDAKWIAIILMPIAILSVYTKFSPFFSERNKKIWSYYLAISTLIVLFFYGADFGNFSYNHTRINASALNFAEDPIISFKMLWQSYPMVWLVTALIVAVILLVKLFKRTHVQTNRRNSAENQEYKKRWHVGAIIFLCWCIYGIFSIHPIKWKDAFELNDNFKSYVALNPLQNFFTTLRFRKPSFEDAKAKEYYPVIADFLQLSADEIDNREYSRVVLPHSKSLESRPNIVLIICETFSMYKSSMSGNPLNTTPYFQELCDNGIFFKRCFTPTFGTARGVFATLTGIPDVQLSKFSTRNPQAINQHTIINELDGYNNYYFIGGSTDFNNFEGLLKNINGVKIYQEGSYKAEPINVWGISDKNLFLEATGILNKNKNPFFAIIQTADNHRPYNIPEEDTDFERRVVPEDTLQKYGFESLKEFQAFCYTDYCYKKFMEAAKKESWFSNTIFVFVGDHGVSGETASIFPQNLALHNLSDEHVPLLFYAPELLTPKVHDEVVSQIDVLPTIAGMLHEPYTNTTLGRDLLNQKNKLDAAFIIHHDEGNIGVVTNDFYFMKNLQINKQELTPMNENAFSILPAKKDSIKKSLSLLTDAMYETAKWMLVNNKKKD